jgi:hypothetical protein
MQKQIASFLFQNKSCPLPGLGTLSIINSGAEADFTNKTIAAPKPFIQFTNTETETADLLDYLAASTEGSKYEVTEALDHFCYNLKKQISERSNAKLESIGNFFVDETGNISFTQEELPTTFLQPVYAERVIHPDAEHNILVGDKETTNTVMTEFFNETVLVKDRWWIWAIVLGVVCVLAIIIYFTQLNGTSSFGNAIKI